MERISAAEGRKPNLLIIVADQLRHDCVGWSGGRSVRTPHLDQLASEGMAFRQAYSPIPVCGPARQAFVCGQRPETYGGLWNPSLGLPVKALEPDSFSWARSLEMEGYRNAYLGKWDVNPDHDPTSYGYGEYIDSERLYRDYLKSREPAVTYTAGFWGEIDPLPVEETRTHRTAALAIEAMEKLTEGTGPWQLRVNFTEPHLPCRPAAEFAALYSPEEIPPWESFVETFEGKPYIQGQQLRNWKIEEFTWEDWAPAVARYYAVITQLDDAVGRILKALEDAGQKEQTMVVFTSDHGDMAGGHRMIDKHYVMYDDVVRVPFLIRWPGVIPPGSRSDAFVYPFLDLPPTLLDLAGAPHPEGAVLAGRSLLPLWTGEEDPVGVPSPEGWREEVVSTYNGQQFGLFSQRMLRTRDWKYVWNPTDTDELYDLKNDPHELNNAVRMPENHRRVQELRRRLYDILLKEGDGLVSTSWMRDQLMEGHKK